MRGGHPLALRNTACKGRRQVGDLSDFRKVVAIAQIVSLQEYLPELRPAKWVVLQVEFVKTAEGVVVGVHSQCVYGEVIWSHSHLFEYL